MNSNYKLMVLTFTALEAVLEKLNMVTCILVRSEVDYGK